MYINECFSGQVRGPVGLLFDARYQVHAGVAVEVEATVLDDHGRGNTAWPGFMMFDRHANLKYKFGNRHFWAEGYYVSTVGLNEAAIAKYIRGQDAHDIALDKLKKYEDPFKQGEVSRTPSRGSRAIRTLLQAVGDESKAVRLERSERQRL